MKEKRKGNEGTRNERGMVTINWKMEGRIMKCRARKRQNECGGSGSI